MINIKDNQNNLEIKRNNEGICNISNKKVSLFVWIIS
jgi:hypothetical protein